MFSQTLYAIVLAFSFLGRAAAQGPCACSPSTYTFKLNLAQTCPPIEVGIGEERPGLLATFCQISPLGDGNETLTPPYIPAIVTNVQVIELGQAFEVINQKDEVDIEDDSFSYTSVSADASYTGSIPKVIQVNIFANDAEGVEIVNFFAISFTNDCNTYPVLEVGNTAGWTEIVSLLLVTWTWRP